MEGSARMRPSPWPRRMVRRNVVALRVFLYAAAIRFWSRTENGSPGPFCGRLPNHCRGVTKDAQARRSGHPYAVAMETGRIAPEPSLDAAPSRAI